MMKKPSLWSRLTGRGAPSASYDAAKARRRLVGWNPSQDSSRSLLAKDGQMMRARARDVVRNNPYASSAADSFVANLIGAGIKPSSMIKDSAKRKELHDLFLAWTDEADADDVADFYGMQATIARALFEAGECFVRRRSRLPGDMDTVPLQLQILESDMLDFGMNETAQNGNIIVNGVEFDRIGRRVAYHFWKEHPGDATVKPLADGVTKVRVPAESVLHIFQCKRPGQVRGAPMIAPAVVKLWLLDQYDDAELDRKKVAAMYAGFITSPAAEEIEDDMLGDGSLGEGVVALEPGTMQTLLPGEEITFSSPADVGGGYEAFQYRNLLACFSAMGVPYTLGTGDLKRSNYSSLRGAIVEYRRRLEQLQHGVMVFQFCRPVWRWFVSDAVLSGAIDLPEVTQGARLALTARWITPKFEWVDPYKDRNAELLAVKAGFKARSEVIEAEGGDPEETDQRIADDREREARLGLNFDSTVPVDPALITEPAEAAEELADEADAAAQAA